MRGGRQKGLPLRRRLGRRIVQPVWLAVRAMAVLLGLRSFSHTDGYEALLKYRTRMGELNRAQWQRWYQANRRRQRQISAYKRLGGARIDPKTTGLRRAMVP